QYNLAFLCAVARPRLMVFFVGMDRFAEALLDKTQIAPCLVPEIVSGAPGVITFEEFMDTTVTSPKDARNVLPPPDGYQTPSDPITIGYLFKNPVLVDGYHRAALLWKFGPKDAALRAYLPVQFASAAFS